MRQGPVDAMESGRVEEIIIIIIIIILGGGGGGDVLRFKKVLRFLLNAGTKPPPRPFFFFFLYSYFFGIVRDGVLYGYDRLFPRYGQRQSTATSSLFPETKHDGFIYPTGFRFNRQHLYFFFNFCFIYSGWGR